MTVIDLRPLPDHPDFYLYPEEVQIHYGPTLTCYYCPLTNREQLPGENLQSRPAIGFWLHPEAPVCYEHALIFSKEGISPQIPQI